MYTKCTNETNIFARDMFLELFTKPDKVIEVGTSLDNTALFILTSAVKVCTLSGKCAKEFTVGALWMYLLLQKCEQEELERIGKLPV